MNSSQRTDKANKSYNKELFKDIFKVALVVVALKLTCEAVKYQTERS